MKSSIAKTVLIAITLMLSAGLSFAADTQAASPQQAASKATASPKSAKGAADAKRKAIAKVKLVDINSAKKEELKKLPGISDAEAAKIIAGRPYGSKAWLVSNNILPEAKYLTVSQLVIAKQPYKDAAKNAALYTKKK
jgi:competence protein ComEA